MPAGPAALGFAYFAAVKVAGYSSYCRWAIQPRLPSSAPGASAPPNALWAGTARTLLGIAFGAVAGLAFWKIPYTSTHDAAADTLFFAMLIPVRILEWWLLLRILYRHFPLSAAPSRHLIGFGILVSFALDLIGIAAAFILPGGIWIC